MPQDSLADVMARVMAPKRLSMPERFLMELEQAQATRNLDSLPPFARTVGGPPVGAYGLGQPPSSPGVFNNGGFDALKQLVGGNPPQGGEPVHPPTGGLSQGPNPHGGGTQMGSYSLGGPQNPQWYAPPPEPQMQQQPVAPSTVGGPPAGAYGLGQSQRATNPAPPPPQSATQSEFMRAFGQYGLGAGIHGILARKGSSETGPTPDALDRYYDQTTAASPNDDANRQRIADVFAANADRDPRHWRPSFRNAINDWMQQHQSQQGWAPPQDMDARINDITPDFNRAAGINQYAQGLENMNEGERQGQFGPEARLNDMQAAQLYQQTGYMPNTTVSASMMDPGDLGPNPHDPAVQQRQLTQNMADHRFGGNTIARDGQFIDPEEGRMRLGDAPADLATKRAEAMAAMKLANQYRINKARDDGRDIGTLYDRDAPLGERGTRYAPQPEINRLPLSAEQQARQQQRQADLASRAEAAKQQGIIRGNQRAGRFPVPAGQDPMFAQFAARNPEYALKAQALAQRKAEMAQQGQLQKDLKQMEVDAAGEDRRNRAEIAGINADAQRYGVDAEVGYRGRELDLKEKELGMVTPADKFYMGQVGGGADPRAAEESTRAIYPDWNPKQNGNTAPQSGPEIPYTDRAKLSEIYTTQGEGAAVRYMRVTMGMSPEEIPAELEKLNPGGIDRRSWDTGGVTGAEIAASFTPPGLVLNLGSQILSGQVPRHPLLRALGISW